METITADSLNTTQHLDYTLSTMTANQASGLLNDAGWIFAGRDHIDHNASVVVLNDSEGRPAAAIAVSQASDSFFQKVTGLSPHSLANSAYLSAVWIAPRLNHQQLLPIISYLGLRQARILNCSNVVSLVGSPNTQAPVATLLYLEKLNLVPTVNCHQQQYVAVAQQLSYSIYKIFEYCDDEGKEFLQKFMVPEIITLHRLWLDRFYSGSWAKSVLHGTMCKEQYVNSLYNLHEYVRQTTRLCARAIAYSDDIRLRNHYIHHLRGEINHELMIERDLEHLGVDTKYLLNGHIPDLATKEFMVVQESTIEFYRDPILFLACPFAAEGVAAHMQPEFIEELLKLIASWGYKKPHQAAHFLSSHINTDGGDDGHWQGVVDIMNEFIRTEHDVQEFLSVLFAAMNGFERGFNANINELQLWSARPQ